MEIEINFKKFVGAWQIEWRKCKYMYIDPARVNRTIRKYRSGMVKHNLKQRKHGSQTCKPSTTGHTMWIKDKVIILQLLNELS